MKNLFVLFIILFFTTTSCNVLDVKSQDAIRADVALSNKSGIDKSVLGTYDAFQSLSYYGRSFVILPDLAADILIHPIDATSVDYSQVASNHILPDNGNVEGWWDLMYDGINRANNVIAAMPNIHDMTDDEKNQALGEMYFTRALNHFNLLNYFGAIPIKAKPTLNVSESDAGRDLVESVFTQIISDLTFAEQHTAKSSVKIRASRYAATALLARVYLFKGDYANASAKATEVINNGGYTLLPNFADIFSAEGTAESIFEIDFTELDRNRIAEYNFPKSLNGRREVAPSPDLIAAFEVGDARLPVSVAYSGTEAYANKYRNISLGSENVLVLRIAEMYLIRAEALAHTNGSISAIKADIDAIRSRAKLSGTSAATYPELLAAILKERRVEFAFEGYRWFDLVRTGTAMALLPNVTSTNQLLYPIPLNELLTNTNPGMTQNPGY
jgi:hypothetical protein